MRIVIVSVFALMLAGAAGATLAAEDVTKTLTDLETKWSAASMTTVAPGSLPIISPKASIIAALAIGVRSGRDCPALSAGGSLAAALEAWVEQGRAPEQVIAQAPARPGAPAGQAVRTGPLCAYPKRATFTPGADPMQAGSFSCRA